MLSVPGGNLLLQRGGVNLPNMLCLFCHSNHAHHVRTGEHLQRHHLHLWSRHVREHNLHPLPCWDVLPIQRRQRVPFLCWVWRLSACSDYLPTGRDLRLQLVHLRPGGVWNPEQLQPMSRRDLLERQRSSHMPDLRRLRSDTSHPDLVSAGEHLRLQRLYMRPRNVWDLNLRPMPRWDFFQCLWCQRLPELRRL